VIALSSFYFLIKLLGVSNLIGFIWAAAFHFKHPQKPDPRKYIISFCALFATGVNLFVFLSIHEIPIYQVLFSFCLFVTSAIIFWSAILISRGRLDFAFSKQNPSLIIKNGPYKYMRHPFYMSYSLTWLAGFVLSFNLVAGIAALIMFGLYYNAAKYEEKQILESELKNSYLEYTSNKKSA